MDETMHDPWRMGHAQWLETGFFVLVTVIFLVVLAQCRRRDRLRPAAAVPATAPAVRRHDAGPRWRAIPEIQLLVFALPLELFWEIAQFPLYTVWHEGDWPYILYGLAHCTLGDLAILLGVYWVVALRNLDRRWYLDGILRNGFLFTLLGAVYTVFSEILNVRIKGTWDYTELMPLLPFIEIGAMPLMQWILIPPLLLWLMRLLTLSPARG